MAGITSDKGGAVLNAEGRNHQIGFVNELAGGTELVVNICGDVGSLLIKVQSGMS